MRVRWVIAGLIILCAVVLAFAWVDGGREPVRVISKTIPVPEGPR